MLAVGLMIGFTFAMALARFEARRDAVLNEANAIGTTALRARLLPEPHRTEFAGSSMGEYVKIRLDITARPPSQTELKDAIDRSDVIQEALWQQAKVMTAKDSGMVPTGLFIQTLNEMIDNQSQSVWQRFATGCRTLYCCCFSASQPLPLGFTGYATGLDARRTRPPVYIVGLLVAVVILLIVDLDRPSGGFIKVSQQPMIDTAAGIAALS